MAVIDNGVPISKSADSHALVDTESQSNNSGNTEERIANNLPEGAENISSAQSLSNEEPKTPKIRVDRRHITTIDEVREAKSEGMSKMSLGDGLQAHFEENGLISFHFRLSENGHDTTRKLGDSQSMSIEEAREKTKTYRDKALQERVNRSDIAFQELLAIPSTRNAPIQPARNVRKKYRCFSSIKDAGKFLRYLFSENGISLEIKLTLYILLLTPIHPRELFRAEWEDFKSSNMIAIPRQRMRANDRATYQSLNQPTITVLLSKQAISAIHDLKKCMWPGEYILPHFYGRTDSHSEELLNKYMQETFLGYSIKPSEFMHFFRDMAVENSGFREEFIDDMITFGSMPTANSFNDARLQLRHALIDWWGDELESAHFSAKF